MLKLKLNINGLGNYVCEQPLIFSNGYEFFLLYYVTYLWFYSPRLSTGLFF